MNKIKEIIINNSQITQLPKSGRNIYAILEIELDMIVEEIELYSKKKYEHKGYNIKDI